MNEHLKTDKWGDLDMAPLAEALAAELGGQWVQNTDADGVPMTWHQSIQLGQDLIHIRRVQPGRIRVTIWAADIPGKVVPHFTPVATPSATFDAKRPLPAIAREIMRRVVTPAQKALEENRAKARARIEYTERVAAEAERMRRDFPAVRVDVSDGGQEVSFSYYQEGSYFHGRMGPDGRAYFERIGTLSAEKSRRVLAILTEV